MFLVMELCTGGELAEALKEKRYFMESEVKVITKELASAITYLHKIGKYLFHVDRTDNNKEDVSLTSNIQSNLAFYIRLV
jgi:serine/threonine protein kinase